MHDNEYPPPPPLKNWHLLNLKRIPEYLIRNSTFARKKRITDKLGHQCNCCLARWLAEVSGQCTVSSNHRRASQHLARRIEWRWMTTYCCAVASSTDKKKTVFVWNRSTKWSFDTHKQMYRRRRLLYWPSFQTFFVLLFGTYSRSSSTTVTATRRRGQQLFAFKRLILPLHSSKPAQPQPVQISLITKRRRYSLLVDMIGEEGAGSW